MNDYSKYMKEIDYFIKSINLILEDGNQYIEVIYIGTTARYELNKDNIDKLYSQLKYQYEILANNLKKIKAKKENIPASIAIISLALLAFVSSVNSADLISTFFSIGVGGVLTSLVGFGISSKETEKRNQRIKFINNLLNDSEILEEVLERCESIRNSLSRNAQKSFEEEQSLVDAGLISTPYNINFTDKCTFKDVELFNIGYNLYKDLGEPVSFSIDNKHKVKERIKKIHK